MERGLFQIALGALVLSGIPAQAAAPDPAPRVELPIREVVFHGAVRRYAVQIQIDGQPVEAGLDTGSTGLRVLPRALSAPAITEHGEDRVYSYASGVEFRGAEIRRGVTFGALGGGVPLMRIDRIGCKRDQGDCRFASVDPATYGIQGDGVPGQGFVAILGIGLKLDAVENPFEALGARTWIVELPRPGDSAPGRLILNPTDAEVASYRMIELADDGNNLAGCIAGPPAQGKICGLTHFDSGAPGLRIMTAGRLAPWPQGTPAEIAVGDRKTTATMTVEIGRRDQGSGMMIVPRLDAQQPRISLGIAPYFRWSVLYDARRHQIGLRER